MGVGVFLWTIFSNNLPWNPDISARDYYLEIGNAYGDGFIMGFFLCFFLVLGVVTVGTMLGFIPERGKIEPDKSTERHLRLIRGRRG